ncbi:hypothetical protein GGX14DRAFT_378574 [Mycena pura]|uniref:C3H1-type domain-containing protein n=1 Tax=Mycena pura TaxID=153505 RepID=A0AAD6Y2Q7_9AGAR|nr:hypothetical protein GGX14DRAFT_378574 [Mycena pura]
MAFSSSVIQPYVEQVNAHAAQQRRVGAPPGDDNSGLGSDRGRPNGDGSGPAGRKRPAEELDDEQGPPTGKRAKFNPAAVAWKTEADRFLDAVAYSPQHLLVVKQVEVYSLDIKEALRLLSVALGKPPLPDSLWKDVLLDRFVDLDVIIANRFAMEPDEPQQLVLGDHYLEVKKPKVVSRVGNHGEWLLAFRAFEKAVNFAFNGRRDELEAYENHIHDLFASWHPSLHHRIINYDRAARTLIGQSHGILFSDIGKLRACENAHLSAGGICVASSSSSTLHDQKTRNRKPAKRADSEAGEVCRNHNYGKCQRESECRYRHVCLGCKGDSHTIGDCPDKQRRQA